MRTLSPLFAVLVTVMLIAGCGQKGPLYRPAPEAAPASEAETAGTGSERDDSGER